MPTVPIDRVVLLAISFASFWLAMLVYRRALDRVWNRLYAVHAMAVGTWIFSNYMIQSAAVAHSEGATALWLRLSIPVVALVICTCVDFAWVFPEQISPPPWPQRVILYASGLVFSLVAFAPDLFTSLSFDHGTVIPVYGPPYTAFGVFTVVLLGYADYVMYGKLRRLTGVQRVQVMYVLGGLLVSQAIAIVTMVLLPVVWGNGVYTRWGSAGYIFTILAMAYALAKEHIVGPKVALRRVVALLTLSEFFMGSQSRYVVLTYMLVGLFMGFVIYPLHSYVSRMISRSAPGEQRASEALELSNETILRTLDIDELLAQSADAIFEMLQPDRVAVFLRDDDAGDYLCQAEKIVEGGTGLGGNGRLLPQQHMVVRAAANSPDVISRDEIFRFRSLEVAKPLGPGPARHADGGTTALGR